MAATEENKIEYFEKMAKQARENIACLQPAIAAAHQGGEETQQAIQRGDREAVERLNNEGREMSWNSESYL
jgi:CHASE3 domain sensor protein